MKERLLVMRYNKKCDNIDYVKLLIQKYGNITLIEAMRKEGII